MFETYMTDKDICRSHMSCDVIYVCVDGVQIKTVQSFRECFKLLLVILRTIDYSRHCYRMLSSVTSISRHLSLFRDPSLQIIGRACLFVSKNKSTKNTDSDITGCESNCFLKNIAVVAVKWLTA